MKQAFTFLRLIDKHDGLLSLTNIALIVVIAKLIFVQNAGVMDLGALLLSLAAYNFKKYQAARTSSAAVSDQSDMNLKMEELKSKVNALSVKVGLTRGGNQ